LIYLVRQKRTEPNWQLSCEGNNERIPAMSEFQLKSKKEKRAGEKDEGRRKEGRRRGDG